MQLGKEAHAAPPPLRMECVALEQYAVWVLRISAECGILCVFVTLADLATV